MKHPRVTGPWSLPGRAPNTRLMRAEFAPKRQSSSQYPSSRRPVRFLSLRGQLLSLIAVTTLAFSAPSHAFDLLQAYRLAQANDSQLAAAKAQLEAAREKVPQAQAALLPSVNTTGTLSRRFENVDRPTGTQDYQYSLQNYGVQLTYPLYRLQNVETLEQSRVQAQVGETQFAQAGQDLMLRLAQAYFDVLVSQDNLTTIQAQKRAITEQLAAAKRNFEVGTATVTDQQEAQARFDLAVAQELAANNDVEVKRAALSQLIGRPIGVLNVLRPGVQLQSPEPSRELDWTGAARDSNYAVQLARLNAEIARREIEKQRLSTNFNVDLLGSGAHSRNAAFNSINVFSTTAAVGIQVTKPLYTGGGAESRVRESVASHQKSLSDLESARRTAELAARQAFFGVNSGLAQIRALEAAEKSSQLALDSNLLGYQVGVRINIDVLNAQQQLFTTRRDLSRARYDALINGLRLKTTTGSLKEEDLGTVNALLVAP